LFLDRARGDQEWRGGDHRIGNKSYGCLLGGETENRLFERLWRLPDPTQREEAASGGDFYDANFAERNRAVHLLANFKNTFDGFLDVFQSFVLSFALGDTPGQRGAFSHYEAVFTKHERYNIFGHSLSSR
jgi:hypothetical protein